MDYCETQLSVDTNAELGRLVNVDVVNDRFNELLRSLQGRMNSMVIFLLGSSLHEESLHERMEQALNSISLGESPPLSFLYSRSINHSIGFFCNQSKAASELPRLRQELARTKAELQEVHTEKNFLVGEVERLTKSAEHAKSKYRSIKEAVVCPICLDRFTLPEKRAGVIPCGHVYVHSPHYS